MVYILLGEGFEEAEALVTADVLRRADLPVVLTGIGGGMVRDLLNGEIPSVLRKNVYALAAILGAGAYYLLAHSALPAFASVLLACSLTIGLRLAATYFRWHLPRPNPRG